MSEEGMVEMGEVADMSTPIFKDFYPVNPPFGFVGIDIDEDTGKLK